jgi:phage host-nuclease inhibitor protein Gam
MRSDEEPAWLADTPNGAAGAGGDSGNVDKIRDILFGSQMRDYDRRFASTEERLQREAAALRDDIGRRLLATEQYLRAELDTLAGNLKTEEADRVQAFRAANEALTNLHREMGERLGALTEQTAQQHRELRAQLLELQRAMTDEMQRRHDEISTTLRREVLDLRGAKTDRMALASMFAELAQRLTSEGEPR